MSKTKIVKEELPVEKEIEMTREEAIAYLDRKGEYTKVFSKADVKKAMQGKAIETLTKEKKYNKEFDEKQIQKVMQQGKIYGDPIVELDDF